MNWSIMLLGLCLVSCTDTKKIEHVDDYVLIEFASKLEEDHQQHQKIPLTESRPQ